MSRLSKSGIEDSLGIPSIEELSAAMKKLEEPIVVDEDLNVQNILEGGDVITDAPSAVEYQAPSAADIKEAYASIKNFKVETDGSGIVLGSLMDDLSRLDKISDMCLKYFEDVMDKGFNAEDKSGHFYFGAAAGLMREAVNSHNAKALAKIKFAEFELKRQKMEADNAKNAGTNGRIINNEGIITDRNSLLKKNINK